MLSILNAFTSLWNWLKGSSYYQGSGIVRQLESGEQLMLNINRKGMLIINSVVFLSSNHEIGDDHLRWVLIRLMKIHPLLRMRIVEINGQGYWKEMDELLPDLRVDYSSDWHEVFSQGSLDGFADNTGPLWRLTFMPNAEHDFKDSNYKYQHALVFGFSHAIVDGQARMKLIDEFQDLLALRINEIDFQNLESTIGEPTTLQLANIWEDYAAKTLTFLDKCKLFFIRCPPIKRLLLYKIRSGMTEQHPFDRYVGCTATNDPTIVPKTCVFPKVLSKTDLDLIKRACKQQGVSVHSVLQAAGTISMCEIIANAAKSTGNDNEYLGKSAVACTTTLRADLPKDTFDNVSYVTDLLYGFFEAVDIAESAKADFESFWNLSRHIMNMIHSNKKATIKGYLLMKPVFREMFENAPAKRSNLLSFTNLGNCSYLNRNSETGLKITGHLSASSEHISGPIFANCITTLDDKMIWGAVYFPNVTSRLFAERYVTRAVEILDSNCRLVLNDQ